MKKVGIVSCYFKHNYGSMLQAYATQRVLNNMEIENETINVEKNEDFVKGKKKYYLSQMANVPFLMSKSGMIRLKIDKKIYRKLRENIEIRDKKYEEFKKKFNLTIPYKNYEELSKISNNYSNIIVGSDQLWLPVNVVADYYTLNWVPDDINKISLATSFGVSSISNKYRNIYKSFLDRIDHLSVREKSGVKLVRKLSDKEATLVCDPSMLLTPDEWMEIQTEEPVIDGKYILCYFLGNNIEHRKFAERLRKKTGLKIVSINHADEFVRYNDKFADEIPYNIGPGEWINLIRNAEYVCTDSLHGTIFSLMHNKEFFTFERYKSNNSQISTNLRIHSLLGIFNLKYKILNGNEDVEDALEDSVNYEIVNKKIEEFRNDSKNYLKNTLKY